MRLARLVVLAAIAALIVAPSAFALRFSDASLLPPTGSTGQAYFHKLDGAGGCNENDYEFRVIGGTSLPPGLALRGSSNDWRIEGTPTQAGDFDVWLQMWSDVGGTACELLYGFPPKSAERMITIRISQGLAIQQGQAAVPTGTVGQAYGPVQFTASGGGSQAWSATQIPAGLTMSPSGVLSGTPTTKSGDSKLVVRVQDSSGRSHAVTYNLPVRDALVLNAQQTPEAEVGRPFTIGFSAAGGNEAYTWEATGLPAGLAFNPATRVLSGTPTAAGAFTAKVTVKDGEGRVTAKEVGIEVAAPLTIATTRLRAAKAGKRYTITFRVRGGTEDVQWRLLRFRPSAKLSWDKTTGRLSFVPSAKRRSYTIIVRATDSLNVRATQTLTLTVKK